MEQENRQGILLSLKEAEEYGVFKKQKRIAEALSALSRAEIQEPIEELPDLKKGIEHGKRMGAAAIKTSSLYLTHLREFARKNQVKIDCVIGQGEVATKVKVAETKYAARNGASEITLCLSPFAIKNGRTAEIKREIKKVVKSAKKRPVKVALPVSSSEWAQKISKLTLECGGKFISIPYRSGVERIKESLSGGCKVEVTGVHTPTDYKTLVGSGVDRIALSCGEEVFELFMKEAEESSVYTFTTESVPGTIESKSIYTVMNKKEKKEYERKENGIE